MKLSAKVKERIARIIGSYFTTNEIEGVFSDAGVQVDRDLYAKWRITLDGFSKCALPEDSIPHIIKEFAHPLSFEEIEQRERFIEELNEVLFYDKVKIETTETGAKISNLDGVTFDTEDIEIPKTSTDYLVEAINFFKNEYNKIRIVGLTYEYPLGDNFSLSNYEPKPNEINHAYHRRVAVGRLKEVGFVTDYELEGRVIDDAGNVFDYAICKIDESKITEQKEAPRSNQPKTEELIDKVIKHEHNHKHSFENSIQEKDVTLNHKYDSKKPSSFYITKKDDDFYYKGKHIGISKKTDYYKVFSALYAKLPEGGEILYKDIIEEIKNRISKTKKQTDDETQKFIQRNLTDKSNGFLRYAKIEETEDNGKPLISVIRGSGIYFNNKTG